MKLTKFALMAVAATLALGVYSAKAQGTTTDYSRLTFDLTIKQQTTNTYKGDATIYHITKIKVTNKDVLAFLAEAFNTTWPAGAQLEYDWDSDQVIVADSTGTNVLFYCYDGVENGTVYAYLNLDWYYDNYGPYTGKYVNATPGSYVYTEYYQGYVQLHYSNSEDSSVYTDLYGYGLNEQQYSDKWTTTTDKGSDTEVFEPVATGYYYNEYALMTGKIVGKQKWSEANVPK